MPKVKPGEVNRLPYCKGQGKAKLTAGGRADKHSFAKIQNKKKKGDYQVEGGGKRH